MYVGERAEPMEYRNHTDLVRAPGFILRRLEPFDTFSLRLHLKFHRRKDVPLTKVVPRRGLNVIGGTNLLGFADYEGLRYNYLAWHYTRDKSLLVKPMEMHYKQNYYSMPLWTKTGQSGDRVSVHKNLVDFMFFGGLPSARDHIVPNFAVSYEGFSPEMAALVIDDTEDLLRWVGYNFEPGPQSGLLRVWRLAPGTYEIRTGLDMDDVRETATLGIPGHRDDPFPLPLSGMGGVQAWSSTPRTRRQEAVGANLWM